MTTIRRAPSIARTDATMTFDGFVELFLVAAAEYAWGSRLVWGRKLPGPVHRQHLQAFFRWYLTERPRIPA